MQPYLIWSNNPKNRMFIEAVYTGNIEVVKSMISQGVNVNLKDNGEAIIVIAAAYRQTEVVQILLEAGV